MESDEAPLSTGDPWFDNKWCQFVKVCVPLLLFNLLWFFYMPRVGKHQLESEIYALGERNFFYAGFSQGMGYFDATTYLEIGNDWLFKVEAVVPMDKDSYHGCEGVELKLPASTASTISDSRFLVPSCFSCCCTPQYKAIIMNEQNQDEALQILRQAVEKCTKEYTDSRTGKINQAKIDAYGEEVTKRQNEARGNYGAV
ncbi:unnamed protein product [Amoebophrya sp. A120]|nr:unnamed protein product [Amoebophrya sp. A120]|eukprot:GSA120T00015805001.1